MKQHRNNKLKWKGAEWSRSRPKSWSFWNMFPLFSIRSWHFVQYYDRCCKYASWCAFLLLCCSITPAAHISIAPKCCCSTASVITSGAMYIPWGRSVWQPFDITPYHPLILHITCASPSSSNDSLWHVVTCCDSLCIRLTGASHCWECEVT